MLGLLRELWEQPRIADRPARTRWETILVGILLVTATAEGVLRDDIPLRVPTLAFAYVAILTLLWRNREPLGMALITFGLQIPLQVALIATGRQIGDVYSLIAVLLLIYSVFRWDSGRAGAATLALVFTVMVIDVVLVWTSIGDLIGAIVVVLLPAELGVLVRRRAEAKDREVEDAKSRERELLARELHDTVAHHVSAIAVQAQAGRAVAATDPSAAVEVLAVIEEEATRTLAEMRSMVGALRGGDEAVLTPGAGTADLERLADAVPGLDLEVHRSDGVGDVTGPVGQAIYRIVQEAVTNVVRHARGATHVVTELDGDVDHVTVTVTDDGAPTRIDPDAGGYGLIGMEERASLIGGTFEAGPLAQGGWRIRAQLPRRPDTVGRRTAATPASAS